MVNQGDGKQCGRTRKLINTALVTSSITALMSSASLAQAQTTNAPAPTTPRSEAGATNLPEVTVTARRVQENIQKVPIAVTAIQPVALHDEAIVTQLDLQFHSPSLQSRPGASGELSGGFSLRGIPGVSLYYAEAIGGPTFPGAPFFDVSSVQVLNGPQGTLFGRSSIGGAVLVSPARPNLTRASGFLDVTAGGDGLSRGTAAINIPIIQDQLAVRIALNRNTLNGYTQELGTGQRFDSTNNYSARVSVLWKPGDGRFTNYAVFNYFGADQAPPATELTLVNPAGGLFPLPAAFYPFVLAAPCTAAVANGIASTVANCISQRSAFISGLLPDALAEQARLRAGGSAALSYTANSGNGGPRVPYKNTLDDFTFVNQSEYDFGKLGPTTFILRDIFSVQAARTTSDYQSDGLGGDIISAAISFVNGPMFGVASNCAQQHTHFDAPATLTPCTGPLAFAYTEELQGHGVVGDNLATWQAGAYFEYDPVPKSISAGSNSAAIAFSGVTLETWGWSPTNNYYVGGRTTSTAIYGQSTLNFSRLVPFIAGLHLTGGARYTWDSSTLDENAVDTNPVTGAWTQGAHVAPTPLPGVPSCGNTTNCVNTSGLNTTISLDAQITPKWLVYVASRGAYVPGGINFVVTAQSLPGFVQTYAPETVRDYEIGSKVDFSFAGGRFRLNAALYRVNFNNIFVQILAGTPPSTYITNAAAATIQGAEFQGEMIFNHLDVSGSYTFTDAHYTRYFGTDPFSVQTIPGSSYCAVPPSTATVCLLDLSKSVVPDTPKSQLSLNVAYTIPLSDDRGYIKLIATGYYQSSVAFTSAATQAVQLYGPTLGYDNVRRSAFQDGYEVYNLRAEWQHVFGTRIDLGVFVDNVSNTRFATYLAPGGLGNLGYGFGTYGQPRTWGLDFHYEFGS